MLDIDYWEEKFRARPDSLLAPEGFLVAHAPLFVPGTVLDVACGDGRNAIHLARRGFAVLGVDFSPAALARLARFARRENLAVETREMDLTDAARLVELGAFANVLVNHYPPGEPLLAVLPRLVRPGGTLLICGFGPRQAEGGRFPREFCLDEGGYASRLPGFVLVEEESFADERGFLAGYVFRRPQPMKSTPSIWQIDT